MSSLCSSLVVPGQHLAPNEKHTSLTSLSDSAILTLVLPMGGRGWEGSERTPERFFTNNVTQLFQIFKALQCVRRLAQD